MTRTIVQLTVLAMSGALVFACSDDESEGGTGGTGATGGKATGGASGKGGASGTGGASATGGAGGGADAGDSYECQANLVANPRDPGGTGAVDSACCNGLGTCTTASSITGPAATSYGHETCQASSDLVCAPTDAALADAAVAGVFTVCTARLGDTITLEGRCLPKCFILGNPQAGQLSGEGCPAADAGAGEQICAPCYNPIDGTATGACTQKAGDAPTEPAPTPFKPCGSSDGGPTGGLCVPLDLATASNNPAAANLPQLECATGEVCAPTVKVEDISACFQQCESAVASLGPQYTAGACVPYYVIASDTALAAGLAVLTQGTCSAGELCAPCLNPLNSDAPTGACQ